MEWQLHGVVYPVNARIYTSQLFETCEVFLIFVFHSTFRLASWDSLSRYRLQGMTVSWGSFAVWTLGFTPHRSSRPVRCFWISFFILLFGWHHKTPCRAISCMEWQFYQVVCSVNARIYTSQVFETCEVFLNWFSFNISLTSWDSFPCCRFLGMKFSRKCQKFTLLAIFKFFKKLNV